MNVFLENLVYAFAYMGMVACVIALVKINKDVAEDLSRRRRLRWYEYLSDSAKGCMIEWIVCFICCWPGLFIGDLGKEEN